jgi:hypothetical protein
MKSKEKIKEGVSHSMWFPRFVSMSFHGYAGIYHIRTWTKQLTTSFFPGEHEDEMADATLRMFMN